LWIQYRNIGNTKSNSSIGNGTFELGYGTAESTSTMEKSFAAKDTAKERYLRHCRITK
jgi:hypothetical protein